MSDITNNTRLKCLMLLHKSRIPLEISFHIMVFLEKFYCDGCYVETYLVCKTKIPPQLVKKHTGIVSHIFCSTECMIVKNYEIMLEITTKPKSKDKKHLEEPIECVGVSRVLNFYE